MKSITEKIVSALPVPPRGNKLHYFSGAKLQGKTAPSGFAIRVTAAGAKSFVWFHRKDGKQYLETLGRWDEQGGDLSVLRAILAAQDRAKSVRNGGDPRPQRTRHVEDGRRPAADTVASMLDDFVDQYIMAKKQRSAGKTKRILERLVVPCIGKLGIYELRRSDVARMLDKIAKENGPVMADRTLAIVRKAFHWRAARDDDFHPPVAKDMTRGSSKARDRFLSDDEIRDMWTALDGMTGTYPAIIRTLLLTASRRGEVGGMRWDEIVGEVWTIPAARYKTKVMHEMPLSTAVRSILSERAKGGPFVFSSTAGRNHFGGWTKAKGILDKRIAELRATSGRGTMPEWTVHDLRHTARTLMARAGVPNEHAEQALGHKLKGVQAVYNQHPYLDEKRDALEKLAAMIVRILNPLPSNVETLGEHRARAQL